MGVAKIITTIVTPVSLVERDLVPTRNTLNFVRHWYNWSCHQCQSEPLSRSYPSACQVGRRAESVFGAAEASGTQEVFAKRARRCMLTVLSGGASH